MEHVFLTSNYSSISVTKMGEDSQNTFLLTATSKIKTKKGYRRATTYAGLDRERAIAFANKILELTKEN